MFEYNFHQKLGILNITLPKELQYNFSFMNAMTGLVENVVSRRPRQVRVSCQREPEYDKMCKAYIFNVLRNLSKQMMPDTRILWSVELNNTITSAINTESGSKFNEIDVTRTYISETLSDYRFDDEQSIKKPVEEIAKIIVNKNSAIERNVVREFLTTTIGEIFSNAFLHSDREELFLLYDVEVDEDDFYLCVTVIDYGKTIIQNVKDYFRTLATKEISSKKCIAWAIVERNTTRQGSGGYGLSTLINCIKEVNGELIIISGDAVYKQYDQHEEIDLLEGIFLGTSVTFRIKLFETDKLIGYDEINERLISISLDDL